MLACSAMPLTAEVASLLAPVIDSPHDSALLFDIDGTLSPIVERAQDAALFPGVRELLAQAVARFGYVAFVTGRSPDDLDRIVAMPTVDAATNHGMELRRGGVVNTAEAAAPYRDTIQSFASRWTGDTSLDMAGVWLENKGSTLSFHFRTAPDPDVAKAFLDAMVGMEAEDAGLAIGWGRRILEVRPPVAIDKGTAVRELLDGTGAKHAVYLGDDLTDMDAWRELRQMRTAGLLETALCIAAASDEASPVVAQAADATVDGPSGVSAVLDALVG